MPKIFACKRPPFIHLRVHSEFSIVDGLIRIKDLIKQVINFSQPAVALTDLSNIFGLIKFYKNARKFGIKPIVGCDVWIHNDHNINKPYRLLLLVRNLQGYRSLCKLLTQAFSVNKGKEKAEIHREWFKDLPGFIVISGARAGDVGCALDSGNIDLALESAQYWSKIFPNSYYIELQRVGFSGDEAYVQSALNLAYKLGLPVVATHPVQFLYFHEFQTHEVRVCISEGKMLADPRRKRRFTQEQYLLSSEEMIDRFSDIPSALENTVEIAKRCNLILPLGMLSFPDFPTPKNISLNDYLIQLSEIGLEKRLLSLFPDQNKRMKESNKYQERLHHECNIISQMGFSSYFLIVQDFVNWGKKNTIPVGPGRGSGAGSLVAYALGITDLDPIHYNLLFERFLNPERVSMPDFDIDFCQDNRERVIHYVKTRYGQKSVSQIATYGTFGAKAVLRDIGRVLGLPYTLCDSLSKLIPFNPSEPWTLDRALKDESSFKERYEKEETVRKLVDLAKPLEGLIRNVGMHAGGILIAPSALIDFCPLYCQLPGQESNMISQFDKDDIELLGLIKFDLLGLRNLTILNLAVRYIRQFNESKRHFNVKDLDLNDQKTYNILSNGNTTAIFQLESRGMKELLKKLKPNNFEDIVAMLALYRPGPLESGMVDDFVNRKHGRSKVDYFHPDLENILKSTYGVIVYQEQVMLISQLIGGYSLGKADLLRRAMGKKKPEEMAKHRILFEKGAKKNGYGTDLAIKLFNLMEKFAGYGFNRSHSVAYALIAYQTAWLKAHHPAEFLAATISSDMDDTDKVRIFCDDAKKNSIKVLPPDINISNFQFEPVLDQNIQFKKPPNLIRYGLGAIKGVGKSVAKDILIAREKNGLFSSFFDFCCRVINIVNRRTIEALIKAGAFDSIESNRAALLASVNTSMAAAEQIHYKANQSSLFGDDSSNVIAVQISKISAWNLKTKLIEEKSVLGYCFSGHLFDYWKDEVRRIIPLKLVNLEPKKYLQWISGVLISMRVVTTRRGKVTYGLLDDKTAQVEVLVSDQLYRKYRNYLKEDQLLIVQGRVFNNAYSGGMYIIAERLCNLKLAYESKFGSNLNNQIDSDKSYISK